MSPTIEVGPGGTSLFDLSDEVDIRLQLLDDQIPVLTADNIYRDPLGVRRWALDLEYSGATANYPGSIARLPANDPAMLRFIRVVVAMMTRYYLPRLPALPGGFHAKTIKAVDTDFAVVNVHPADLTPAQRAPHVDEVPLFGLVYLNQEDRGGTLFFRTNGDRGTARQGADGYPTGSNDLVEQIGRIEGRFNRLAIYPGFILHTGEVKGDWIKTEERFASPRLTQRLSFYL
jgi:hypothetical protein